jgi:MOSC domain-containing protein YiiM
MREPWIDRRCLAGNSPVIAHRVIGESGASDAIKTMQTVPRQLSMAELERGLADVLASPRDVGRVETIVVRPGPNERRILESAVLTPGRGIEGDRWADEQAERSESGNQVSLMNARILRQIAAEEEAICLAGDNLILDFDLSEDFLPAGSRMAIGANVVIEITETSHTGCSKFAARYGNEARAFINNERGRELHLRGRYARILSGGTIAVGDDVYKLAPHA